MKIWEVYNLLNTSFAQKSLSYFDFLIAAYFPDLDILEARYLAVAFPEVDRIVKEYQIKEQEKEAYKQAAYNKIKKK